MSWDRCPTKLGAPDVENVVQSYVWLDRFGVLPFAGGMLDQHPLFLEAVKLIEFERSQIQREEARITSIRNKLHGQRN